MSLRKKLVLFLLIFSLIPVLYSFAASLPEDIKWETNMDDPHIE